MKHKRELREEYLATAKVACMPTVCDPELEAVLGARGGDYYLCEPLERVLPRIAQDWETWKGVYAKCIVRTEMAIVKERLRMEKQGRRLIHVPDRALHFMPEKKILHQVWIQGESELPERFQRNRELWRAGLPDDWTLMLWDDAAARQRWPDYAMHSDRCLHHATRADLIVARCLRDYGGLCADTDCYPVNIDGLLNFIRGNDTMLILECGWRQVSNGLVWSAQPWHPYFAAVVQHQMRENGRYLSEQNVPKATGPGCYHNMLCARDWDLSLVSSGRAYTHHWSDHSKVNEAGWVNPVYAASWWR